jgi:type I restriction-modification system DNA methylase subunit
LLKPGQWRFLEEQAFTGYDNDANMVKIAILNLYLHQLERAHITMLNPLTTGIGGGPHPGLMFDIILANPPFAGNIQQESILADLNHRLDTRSTELLFLKWFIDHLAPNGHAGVIVPQGVLSEQTKAAKGLRSMLVRECRVEAVITLPAGCFRPYADAETAILLFQKGKATTNVWMYELANDGFSQDDRRTPVAENDLADILSRWPNREESAKSFSASIAEIESRGLMLMPGEFKKERLTFDPNKLPDGWKLVQLRDLVEEIDNRAGQNHSLSVLSVTKHQGFVESATYFTKRIFSEDTSGYKIVERGQFAYSTIHLDEGAIGYLDNRDAGVISPMYKVFRLRVSEKEIRPEFLFRMLKCPAFVEKYKSLGKGSIKRRKSVAFEKFASLTVPIPPDEVQRRVVCQTRAIGELESRLKEACSKLADEVEQTLRLAGLS